MLGVEGYVELDVARLGLEAEGFGLRAMAGGVGPVAQAVGVLEEVDLRGLLGGEVDVVAGGDRVVGRVFGAGGWRTLISTRHLFGTGEE